MKKKKLFARRGEKIKYGGFSTLLLLLFIAALAALNVAATSLEKQRGLRADLSFNGITTQSETTKKILSELDKDVHIYALFPKGGEDAPLMELLDRYAAASPHITWEQVDPSLNPALLVRFSDGTETVSSDSLIVLCEETDRYRILSPADFISLSLDAESGTYSYAGYTYERSLTGAISYVTRETLPGVVILQGHGELDGETLAAFDALVTDNQYEVRYAELSDASWEPDPNDLLVFFSPLKDLTEAEMEKVSSFAARGGSFLFTCDYTDPLERMPNYRALLRSYGVLPMEGIVVADREEAGSYYNQIRIDLIPEMLSTDVTADLVASGADTVLLPGSRAFETPEETDRQLIVSVVLQSGAGSYLKQVSSETTSLEKAAEDPSGPFALALQARRVTSEGYVSRAFALGCSALLTEEQIYAMTDSQELIIRVLEFLLDQKASNLDIMAKSAVRPGLSARGNSVGSLVVTALPMSVLLLALLILLPRRNR